nr:MAG TPA: hypothetical protein [Caudoviricetes sp.]
MLALPSDGLHSSSAPKLKWHSAIASRSPTAIVSSVS